MTRKFLFALATIVLIATMTFFFHHLTGKPVSLHVFGMFSVELPAHANKVGGGT